MAIVVRCPQCRKWNTVKAKSCKCGTKLDREKFYGVIYYDPDNRQHWKSIGHSKRAAEQFDYEAKIAKNEGRYIKTSPEAKTTFKALAHWYLDLPEVKAKTSYDRDKLSLNRLLPFFGDKLLKEITPAMVEAYRQARLADPSGRTPQTLTKPATVNRELACFKTIFNKAIANGKAERNPAAGVKLLKENNERDRILTPDEYIRLLAVCPPHLKPIVKVAYYTAMRQGEILSLTWGQVDLKEGFITLRPEDTKTNEARLIPLTAELWEMFRAMPRGLPNMPVFTYQGQSVGEVKRSFVTACKAAGIEDFTFHDLRHTAINNWRQAGHDYFRIMAVSGHKTMSVFKRYNTVDREEIRKLVEGQGS